MAMAANDQYSTKYHEYIFPQTYVDGPRIDLKMAELRKEWEAAKKLPAVTGYDEEIKNYQSFLSTVESFMKDMQKARDKGKYSAEDYDAMSNAYEYGLSVI